MNMDAADLPRDLTEEVLSRVPITSLRKIRCTCKRWNLVSKSFSFAKRYLDQSKEFVMMVMVMDFRVYLMRANLDNKACIKREAELISLDDSHRLNVHQAFHCYGLLLCISEDNKTLVVWNPYWGQTRWIIPTHCFDILDMYSYALGYDQKNKCFKVLRFIAFGEIFVEFKIYDLKSDSWRVIDVTRDWIINHYDNGVSLKGNTYWFAKEKPSVGNDSFIVCFDFTKERFVPRLPLPPTYRWYHDALILSTVREEQLAVFFQEGSKIEIWVTTKIEPTEVLWSSKFFLTVDIRRLDNRPKFVFPWNARSFFIDEEKKVAVFFDKEKIVSMRVDGSLKIVDDLGKYPYKSSYPLVCSYVPSLVQF